MTPADLPGVSSVTNAAFGTLHAPAAGAEPARPAIPALLFAVRFAADPGGCFVAVQEREQEAGRVAGALLSLLGLRQRETCQQLGVLGSCARPLFDATRSLEARDLRHQKRASDIELGGKRAAVLVERGLLGDRGPAVRATDCDRPEGTRAPPQLPLHHGPVVKHDASRLLLVPAPGADAPDDEQALAGFHVPE